MKKDEYVLIVYDAIEDGMLGAYGTYESAEEADKRMDLELQSAVEYYNSNHDMDVEIGDGWARVSDNDGTVKFLATIQRLVCR